MLPDWLRKTLLTFIVALALSVLAFAIAIWRWPDRLTTVRHAPVPSDWIVVLGGDYTTRPRIAAALYEEGWAPKILVCGGGDTRRVTSILLDQHVPESALAWERDSQTTIQNARAARKILRDSNARRVILVTSWFHSRRALQSFRSEMPGIEFHSVPTTPTGDDAKEFTLCARRECVKLLYYWARYGILPWQPDFLK